MRNPLTKEAFAEFCEAQGDREYDWDNPYNCACAQYAESLGLTREWLLRDVLGSGHSWVELDAIAIARPRNFSALAARLRDGEG